MQAAAAGPNNVVLDNVHSIKNLFGVAVGKGNNVVVNRSVLYGNVTAGGQVDPSGQLTVDNSVVSANQAGLSGAGSITIANTDLSFNSNPLPSASTSYGNNRTSATWRPV